MELFIYIKMDLSLNNLQGLIKQNPKKLFEKSIYRWK